MIAFELFSGGGIGNSGGAAVVGRWFLLSQCRQEALLASAGTMTSSQGVARSPIRPAHRQTCRGIIVDLTLNEAYSLNIFDREVKGGRQRVHRLSQT